MKKIIVSAKEFVHRNKDALIVGAALGTVVVLQSKGISRLNMFLVEKDLFDEYYLS